MEPASRQSKTNPWIGGTGVPPVQGARLSTGRPFPDGTPSRRPCTSIVISGEDGVDTLAPRLRALGADPKRVFVLDRKDDPDQLPLLVPGHLATLEEALQETRASLVVIDPLVAFLSPHIQTSSDVSVRQALLPLARLAEKHRCALLLVRHLNKNGGFHAS